MQDTLRLLVLDNGTAAVLTALRDALVEQAILERVAADNYNNSARSDIADQMDHDARIVDSTIQLCKYEN